MSGCRLEAMTLETIEQLGLSAFRMMYFRSIEIQLVFCRVQLPFNCPQLLSNLVSAERQKPRVIANVVVDSCRLKKVKGQDLREQRSVVARQSTALLYNV